MTPSLKGGPYAARSVSAGCFWSRRLGLRICWDSHSVKLFLGQRVEPRAYLVLREPKNLNLLLKTWAGKLPGSRAVHWARNSRNSPTVLSSQGHLGVQASAFQNVLGTRVSKTSPPDVEGRVGVPRFRPPRGRVQEHLFLWDLTDCTLVTQDRA